MSINKSNSIVKKQGFTLVEVLVTLVILSLGLLGVAGLQITGLRNNLSAEQRGQATQLVYDMADRIRSNIPRDPADALIVLGIYRDQDPAAAAANNGCLGVASCTSAQLAVHDLFEWNRDVENALPGGVVDISVAAGVYIIGINWDDNRDGNVDASDANFQARFQL